MPADCVRGSIAVRPLEVAGHPLAPPPPYDEALAEMLRPGALLLFQAANCNHHNPAKLYEYLRAGSPVLAPTDPAGDTAEKLIRDGIGTVVRLSRTVDVKPAVRKSLRID